MLAQLIAILGGGAFLGILIEQFISLHRDKQQRLFSCRQDCYAKLIGELSTLSRTRIHEARKLVFSAKIVANKKLSGLLEEQWKLLDELQQEFSQIGGSTITEKMDLLFARIQEEMKRELGIR